MARPSIPQSTGAGATTPHTRHDLDPADWDQFRALSHEVLDDMIDYLRTVRDRPAWQSPSREARQTLDAPTPHTGRGLEDVYADFKRHILPYPTGNIHPRFWGWVMGSGTPVGMLAEMMAATMNCNCSGFDQGPSVVERQVIAWLADLMGFPKNSSGVLVSGGTAANLIGVTIARNHATDQRVRKDGIPRDAPGPMVVYGSSVTHGWAERACDLLGLGERGFRKVPVDARHRVKLDDLTRMIREDRARGAKPICIVGNAGTVACGATDDLGALADIAAAEDVWLHIDGAFGAFAKLSPRHAHICDGLERADSVALDLHKWGYVQYEAGSLIVRDAAAHTESFSFAPSYLETARGGIAINPTEFASLGVQLSRSFRALKVWMQLSVFGTDRIGAVIGQNIDDVQHLKAVIEGEPELQVLGPAEMNLICFRYVAPGFTDAELDRLNGEVLVRVQESGVAVPSNARVDGKFAIRVANTNHRSRPEDFRMLVDAVVKHGRVVAPEMRPRSGAS